LKKQLAICAGLLLLGLGTAGTAVAQAVYPSLPDPALPPYEIMSIVRSTGLAPLTRPIRRGPYYVLVAVDRVGRQMRVVVDAQLGDIVNLRPALASGSYGLELGGPYGLPGRAAATPDTAASTPAYGSHPSADAALPPTPPRSIPNVRAGNSPNNVAVPPPTRLAIAEPAPPPPLPRPRPKLALNEAPAAAPAPAEPPAGKPPAPAAAPSGAGEAAKPIE
jgi:hypothetical protein